MKLMEYLLPVALAQNPESGIGNTTTKGTWTLGDFNFLDVLAPRGSAEAAFSGLLTWVISIVLIVAALIAFIYLIMAGFQYITAGGDAGKATTARTGIINALIGIVIIVVSYIVLRYVASLVV